jgi:hypothetical protein
VSSKLCRFVDHPTPILTNWNFEDIHPILFLRHHIFILREIHQLYLNIHTLRHCEVSTFLTEQTSLFQFFTEPIIPLNLICHVNFDALNWKESLLSDERNLRKLQRRAQIMETAINLLPRLIWMEEYEKLINVILAHCNWDSNLQFAAPSEAEDCLARYFFKPNSDFREQIDSVLINLIDLQGEEFQRELGKLCHAWIPMKLEITERLKVKLVLYRVFFNRCYELLPEFFAAHRGTPEMLEKMERLGNCSAEAREFCIPWNLLPEIERGVSVRELFENFEELKGAAGRIVVAGFKSNPMDQLNEIHQSFVEIQNAVNAQRKEGEEIAMMSFDELFSLFFVLVMALDTVDVFFINWMVNQYAPMQDLSPPFNYAQANLDAVILHINQIDSDALR